MKKPLAIFLVGLAVRIAIILVNPIIFGGDTIIRLNDRYTLLKSYQLPMLQTLIAGVSRISMDPALVRYMVAAIGAIAGVAFYFLVRDLFGEQYAFPAALLFATNPFVTAVSTVPFQEILMLATLFLAFHFFYRERWLWSSLFLAIACLTRYEAWIARVGLAGHWIAHVTGETDGRHIGKWIEKGRFRIGNQQHVRLVDGLESADARSVKADTVLKNVFTELVGGD